MALDAQPVRGGTQSRHPTSALSAAGATRRRHASASVTTRASDGVWLSLDAALLDTEVSVIIGPATPSALHSRLLAAFGLSPREQQIVALVLAGRSTEQIGRELFITPYTVKDHLKAIFDKTGVRSRRELPARLFHHDRATAAFTPIDPARADYTSSDE